MRIVILGLVLLFAGVARMSAAAYFVDFVGGSDANAGTQRSLPWKHCPGDPAAAGLVAAVALLPGDTVYFKGGVEYAFSGPTGIRLDWNGAAGAPVTYDGNSDGSWGTGRAVLTDYRGGNAITAFSSATERRHLVFKAFEFFALGGSSVLPSDTGAPVAGRFGGGIAFSGGALDVLVDDCVFRELGFWEGQKPMAATSLTGVGFLGSGGLQLTLRRCAFSRMSRGCDFSGANGYSQVTVDECVFDDSMVWPVDLPAEFGNAALLSLTVTATSVPGPNAIYGASWTGYGRAPHTEEVSAAYGEQVVFSASALGTPAASFQWYKDGALVPNGFGSRLILGAVDAAAAGTYTAVATNVAGSAYSNSIVLVVTGSPPTPIVPPSPPSVVPPDGSPGGSVPSEPVVAGAPVILQQPINITVTPGGTASFAVVATGDPSLTYQWRKNGLPISGASGPMLTLTGVSISDIANYRVTVANSLGSVLSATATLIVSLSAPVNEAPTITQQPMSATVLAGGNVTFAVTASGTPAPSYQWEKNGVAISGATNPALTLAGVSAGDSASYRVVVSNIAGSVTSFAATLTVNESAPVNVAPTITQQPMSATVLAGSTVTFAVTATGTPAPSYQWEKNGVAMTGATNPALTLAGVSVNDSANYRVVVSNVAGSVTSSAAALTINEPAPVNVAPTITQQPMSATVLAGSTVTFAVTASGTPAPSYQWEKNGVAIGGATNPALTLAGVSANDGANYRVVVTNNAGSVTSAPATLTVVARYVAPPVEPQRSILLTTVEVRNANSWVASSFEVPPGSAQRYLVRVLGPTLAAVGGSGAIADPKFDLYQGGSPTVSNDNWGGEADIVIASSQMGATPFVSANSMDAASIVTLSPGYAVIVVSGVNGATGNALVEVYLLP